jgi:quinol monooxygenase YgiN
MAARVEDEINLLERPFVGCLQYIVKPGRYTKELQESYKIFGGQVRHQPGNRHCRFHAPYDRPVGSEADASEDFVLFTITEWENSAFQYRNLEQNYATENMNVLLHHGEMPKFSFWIHISGAAVDVAEREFRDSDFISFTRWTVSVKYERKAEVNLTDTAEYTRSNTDNVCCNIYSSHLQGDPTEFMEYSVWRSKSAHDVYMEGKYLQKQRSEMRDQFCENPSNCSFWRFLSFD